MKNLHGYIKLGLDSFSLLTKISLSIGFLLVISYFYHINYFPASSYGIFLDLIFVIAFAGFFYFIIMLFAFVWAPFSWLNFILNPDVAKWLFRKDADFIINSYKLENIDFEARIRRKIIFPYFFGLLGYFLLFFIISSIAFHAHIIMSIFMSFSMLSFFLSVLFDTKKEKMYLLRYILCVFQCGTYLLIGVAFIVFVSLTMPHYFKLEYLIYAAGIALMMVLASSICLFPPPNKTFPISLKIWMPIVGTVFISFFCIIFNLIPGISSSIMASLKLGNINNVTLQVNKIGCQLFANANYPIKCNENNSYFINNLNLKWGAGKYYVSFKSDNGINELFIPQAQVLGEQIYRK